MKQPVRSFALGLLTAGIILLIVFYFINDSKKEIDSKMAIEDMISSVESEGYHVLTDSEYISISTQSDQNENDNSQESQEKSTDENGQKKDKKSEKDTQKNNSASSDEKDTATYTLTVEPGMSSIKLSKVLMDNGIVDDATSFNQYLDAQGYSKKIQLGEYDLSSAMSQYEIAELISN